MAPQTHTGRQPTSAPSEPTSVLDGWSLEATLPNPEEIETLAGLLPAGTEVFLTTLPHVDLDRHIEIARRLRAAGLAPVPHVAARYFADRAALEGYLSRLAAAAGMRAVLAIGGELDPPRGAFDSSLAVIESGLLEAHGVECVGIAGYPDGHPKISGAVLDRFLDAKLAAAASAGLRPRVVTQFCFAAAPILGWLERFQGRHPTVPVRVGLAGPASVKSLVRYAMRCGVGMPLDGLGHSLSLAAQLARGITPEDIIRALDLAGVAGRGGTVSTHYYAFGGIERTARWVLGAADGRPG